MESLFLALVLVILSGLFGLGLYAVLWVVGKKQLSFFTRSFRLLGMFLGSGFGAALGGIFALALTPFVGEEFESIAVVVISAFVFGIVGRIFIEMKEKYTDVSKSKESQVFRHEMGGAIEETAVALDKPLNAADYLIPQLLLFVGFFALGTYLFSFVYEALKVGQIPCRHGNCGQISDPSNFWTNTFLLFFLGIIAIVSSMKYLYSFLVSLLGRKNKSMRNNRVGPR